MADIDIEQLKNLSNIINNPSNNDIRSRKVTIAPTPTDSECSMSITPHSTIKRVDPANTSTLAKVGKVEKSQLAPSNDIVKDVLSIGGKQFHKHTVLLIFVFFLIGTAIWMYSEKKSTSVKIQKNKKRIIKQKDEE
jgi:hypothetical protein